MNRGLDHSGGRGTSSEDSAASGLRLILSLLVLLTASCATVHTPDATPAIIAGSVCSELPPLTAAGTTTPVAGSLVAFVSDGAPSQLVVYDLESRRVRFQVPIALRSRPEILHSVVVAVDAAGQLVGFDLADGTRRFRVAVERQSWLGAVQVGTQVIFTSTSLSFRPSERGSTVSAIDVRDGSALWQKRVPYALSRPRAAGSNVYFVSDHADVWALAAESGAAAGCMRLGGTPIDWLETDAAGLLLGASQARRVASTAAGVPSQATAPLELPLAQLPGRPALRPTSYDAIPAGRSAYGRIGVVASLEAKPGTPALQDRRFYYAFYRQLFGYAADGQLLWARLFDSDAVRVALFADTLVVVTEDGTLHLVHAADGSTYASSKLPAHLTSADLVVRNAVAASSEATPGKPLPLRAALTEIALDTDARLLPGRKLAASALGALPDPEATQDLLQLYKQSSAPAELRKHVAEVLATRRAGTAYLVDALLEDYDFLDGRSSPPLAAVVPALIANKETRALPRLADRLFDPDTRSDELTLLVDAIATLGSPSEFGPPLSQFLALYHADSSLAAAPEALIAAARALARSGVPAYAAAVEQLAHAPATTAGLRAGLVPLTAASKPAPAAEAQATSAPAASQEVLPETLSDAQIQQTFVERADDLRTCVLAELARNPSLRALRLAVVITHEGRLTGVQVLPDRPELVACLKPKLLATRFPQFRQGRKLANYTIAVHPNRSLLPGGSLLANDRPQNFWRLAELRGRAAAAVDRVPGKNAWWRNQNPLFVSVDTPTPTTSTETTPPPAKTPTETGAQPKPNEEPAPDAWWTPAQQPPPK